MTTNKDFKQLVRARAAATGERYTAAHAALSALSATQVEDAEDPLDAIFDEALAEGASDIHLVPDAEGVAVRLRVDGRLRTTGQLDHPAAAIVATRLKAAAGLDPDTSEGQDGTFPDPGDDTLHVRVSTLPTAFGEKLTVRFLRAAPAAPPALAALGFESEALTRLLGALRWPNGLVAIEAADTPSRMRMLDAITAHLARPAVDVVRISADAPPQHGVELVLVGGDASLSTTSALRAAFRSDPDILVVDRVVTQEEFDHAMQLVTTGHLVIVGTTKPIDGYEVEDDLGRWLRCVVRDDAGAGAPTVT